MQNFDQQASRYDSVSDVQVELGEALFDMVLDHLPEEPPVVLDLGCGTGHLSLDLASLFPKRLDCLDISPAMLSECHRKLREFFPGASYRLFEGDAETFEPDCSYDAVLSSAAIQWFQDLPAFLSRAKQWLKPKGTLALATFGPRTLEELSSAYLAATGRELVRGTRFVSDKGLAGLCRKAGLSVVDSATCLYTSEHDSPREFLRSLKHMGVTGATGPGLRRSEIAHLEQRLAATGDSESPVKITWELVIVVAQKG